jgi:hypothetical protein
MVAVAHPGALPGWLLAAAPANLERLAEAMERPPGV